MDTKQTERPRVPRSRQAPPAQKKKRPPEAVAPKKRSQEATAPQKRRSTPQEEPVRTTPDVVYVPPKPFNRSRLLLHLATIAAVVIAVILGLSVFFKVSRIEVAGMDKYTAQQIQDASGIRQGDHLLSFGRARAAGKIISQLNYIESVRINIRLPDTVVIEVVEVDVTYSLQDTAGNWWLISSQGKVIETAPGPGASRIQGVILENPTAGEQAIAFEDRTPATGEAGNPIPVTVTAAQRLKTAVDIAAFLETNGIIGQVSLIDVSDMGSLQLQYMDKFQVELGGTDELAYKIKCLKSAVNQFITSGTGILDISDPSAIKFLEGKE